MKKDIIIEYLNREMISAKNYKKYVYSSGLLAIWGIVPGFFLGSFWLYIGVVMLLTFIICTCITLHIMSNELTLRNKIWIQTLIFVCWYFQIGSLSAVIFTYEYGVSYKLTFLYLPSLLVCLFLFVLTPIMLRNGKFTSKRSGLTQCLAVGFTAAVIGWRLGSFLDNASKQDTTVPIILVCFTFVNTALSVGFLNFQKLYYLKKVEKTGDGSMSLENQ